VLAAKGDKWGRSDQGMGGGVRDTGRLAKEVECRGGGLAGKEKREDRGGHPRCGGAASLSAKVAERVLQSVGGLEALGGVEHKTSLEQIRELHAFLSLRLGQLGRHELGA